MLNHISKIRTCLITSIVECFDWAFKYLQWDSQSFFFLQGWKHKPPSNQSRPTCSAPMAAGKNQLSNQNNFQEIFWPYRLCWAFFHFRLKCTVSLSYIPLKRKYHLFTVSCRMRMLLLLILFKLQCCRIYVCSSTSPDNFAR